MISITQTQTNVNSFSCVTAHSDLTTYNPPIRTDKNKVKHLIYKLFDEIKLTLGAQKVLLKIADMTFADNKGRRSVKRMAHECRVSDSTVKRSIKSLIGYGIIDRSHQGWKQTTITTLNLERVYELLNIKPISYESDANHDGTKGYDDTKLIHKEVKMTPYSSLSSSSSKKNNTLHSNDVCQFADAEEEKEPTVQAKPKRKFNSETHIKPMVLEDRQKPETEVEVRRACAAYGVEGIEDVEDIVFGMKHDETIQSLAGFLAYALAAMAKGVWNDTGRWRKMRLAQHSAVNVVETDKPLDEGLREFRERKAREDMESELRWC